MGRFMDAIRETITDFASLIKYGDFPEERIKTFTPEEAAADLAKREDMARMMNDIEDRHGIPRGTSNPKWMEAQLTAAMAQAGQASAPAPRPTLPEWDFASACLTGINIQQLDKDTFATPPLNEAMRESIFTGLRQAGIDVNAHTRQRDELPYTNTRNESQAVFVNDKGQMVMDASVVQVLREKGYAPSVEEPTMAQAQLGIDTELDGALRDLKGSRIDAELDAAMRDLSSSKVAGASGPTATEQRLATIAAEIELIASDKPFGRDDIVTLTDTILSNPERMQALDDGGLDSLTVIMRKLVSARNGHLNITDDVIIDPALLPPSNAFTTNLPPVTTAAEPETSKITPERLMRALSGAGFSALDPIIPKEGMTPDDVFAQVGAQLAERNAKNARSATGQHGDFKERLQAEVERLADKLGGANGTVSPADDNRSVKAPPKNDAQVRRGSGEPGIR